MSVTTLAPGQVTLGLLAGGRATRLGGLDKAWLERDGRPQLLRLAQRLAAVTGPVLASANRDPSRYAAHGIAAVADRVAGVGPLGGLDALAVACATPWLFTLPVDLVDIDAEVVDALAAARAPNGAFAVDADGAQPLVALWCVDALREATAGALAEGRFAVHALQQALSLSAVRFDGVRFGNLNTPDDLAAAGVSSVAP